MWCRDGRAGRALGSIRLASCPPCSLDGAESPRQQHTGKDRGLTRANAEVTLGQNPETLRRHSRAPRSAWTRHCISRPSHHGGLSAHRAEWVLRFSQRQALRHRSVRTSMICLQEWDNASGWLNLYASDSEVSNEPEIQRFGHAFRQAERMSA